MERSATHAETMIREARADELARAADLRRAMVVDVDGRDYDEMHPGWRERYVAFFDRLIAAQRAQVFFAEDGEKLIGMAAVYKPSNHRSDVTLQYFGYICNVYVKPAWRRRGVARALMLRAIDWAKRNGCDLVRLRTSRMGRPLYEGLGFRQSDELEMEI